MAGAMSQLARDIRRLGDSLSGAFFHTNLAILKFANAFTGLTEEESATRVLAYGKRQQARDPRVEAFCTTTNEGRCRVVVRRLGGWG